MKLHEFIEQVYREVKADTVINDIEISLGVSHDDEIHVGLEPVCATIKISLQPPVVVPETDGSPANGEVLDFSPTTLEELAKSAGRPFA